MGNCIESFNGKDPTGKADSIINNIQRQDMKNDKLRKKLLFLGPGDSGKSTIFKQLVTLYGKGYSEKEKRAFTQNVYGNVMSAIKLLVEASEDVGEGIYNGETLDCTIQEPQDSKSVEYIDRCTLDAAVTLEGARHIRNLWNDPGIQNTHKLRDQFQFPYDAEYFMGRLDVISQSGYIPTFEDLLHCRNRTTGILEAQLNVAGDSFFVVDVGGQRNERRKWIHCFEDVTGVIFVAAISEYDQTLFEDDRVNRMEESLALFDEIINAHWFRNTSLIVFLNKSDIFRKKIKVSPFSNCPAFKDYDGPDPPGDDFDKACDYIRQLFLKRNNQSVNGKQSSSHEQRRAIYLHVTCATDTQNIEDVFQDTKDIIMRDCLRKSGII